jgi:hypothetical protein
MRIRLTTIALDHDGRVFAEGTVVEGVTLAEGEAFAQDEIPVELAAARVAAGTAELVVDGVTTVSPAAQAAIALLNSSMLATRAACLAFLDAAEAGTDSDKLALDEARKAVSHDQGVEVRDRMAAFEQQLDAIRDGLAKAAAEKPKRGRGKSGDAG